VRHSWLGIAGQELTPALARELGLGAERGVYVTVVSEGSPAERAGLRGAFGSEGQAQLAAEAPPGGDVILAADGRPVAGIDDLAGYLDEAKRPGDAVELLVEREGGQLTVNATLAEWPA
jgi:S1-C subfamily serine protease